MCHHIKEYLLIISRYTKFDLQTDYQYTPSLLHGAESFLKSYLVLQLIKKFPAFYGTRKFITVLTSAYK